MSNRYTDIECAYHRLELELDCLRMTLADGGPVLSQIADPNLRAIIAADIAHARKRLPEAQQELHALQALFEAERVPVIQRQYGRR